MKAHKDLTNVYINRWGELIYSSFEYSTTFNKYVEYLYWIIYIELIHNDEEIYDITDVKFVIVQYDINTD